MAPVNRRSTQSLPHPGDAPACSDPGKPRSGGRLEEQWFDGAPPLPEPADAGMVELLVGNLKPTRRWSSAAIGGVAIAGFLLIALIGWAWRGNRLLREDAVLTIWSYLKLTPFVLGAIGFGWLARDAAMPGKRPHAWVLTVLACAGLSLVGFVVVGLWTAGLSSLYSTSIWKCLTSIPLLALPGMALLLRYVRGGAVTRPALSGAWLGAASGLLAAVVYGMSCSIDRLAYVGVWYAAGVLVATALGAVAGARWLRW